MFRLKHAAIAAAIIVLIVGAWFVTRSPLPDPSHAFSAVIIILLLVPSAWAAFRWLGRRDAAILFAALGVLALSIETTAIATGVLYGHFSYSDALGWKLFGLTPWTVAFAWTPLVLAAWTVSARRFERPASRVAATALCLVIFDLILDPGAVALGFWRFDNAGEFYGVPLSNFAGWLVSGIAGGVAMELLVRRFRPVLAVPVQLAASGFLVIIFWTAVDAFAGMLVPALIGVAAISGVAAFWLRGRYAFDDMIVLVDENDRPIGTAPKLAAHGAETRLHRAFSVFLFDSSGALLLQQRALTKKTWPGVWSNSCCGHVMLHETVENAARRRIRFELGLPRPKLQVVLPGFRYRAEKDGVVENEICPVLVGFIDAVPRPNPSEVDGIRWVPWHRFVSEVKQPDSGYSPWAVEEVLLLDKNERFRELYGLNTSGSLGGDGAELRPDLT